MIDRLHRYEERYSVPLLILAVVFIAMYAPPIIDPDLPRGVRTFLGVCSALIWLLFAIDFIVRVALAERRWRYLFTHPVDLLIVVLPALRPLRVLRVFTVGHALVSRAGSFSLLRTAQAIAGAAALLIFMSALAVLDSERHAPGSNIDGFGDAFW
jgi:voltage-gated potassium channel